MSPEDVERLRLMASHYHTTPEDLLHRLITREWTRCPVDVESPTLRPSSPEPKPLLNATPPKMPAPKPKRDKR